jgi:hypothetical protein
VRYFEIELLSYSMAYIRPVFRVRFTYLIHDPYHDVRIKTGDRRGVATRHEVRIKRTSKYKLESNGWAIQILTVTF